MPRLSGAAEPPALHRRGVAGAAVAAAAPAVASRAAPSAPAPALDVAPASAPAPAPPLAAAALPRAEAPAEAEAVPPPPQHAYLNEPRLYRQPDGSLGPNKPPPNPYTVANRRAWADLVHYARVNGGDEECTAGRSFRYGVGVSYAQHVAYLKSLGLEPERDQSGAWFGYDPSKEDPLADEAHPFFANAAAAAAAEERRNATTKAAVDAELAHAAAH